MVLFVSCRKPLTGRVDRKKTDADDEKIALSGMVEMRGLATANYNTEVVHSRMSNTNRLPHTYLVL